MQDVLTEERTFRHVSYDLSLLVSSSIIQQNCVYSTGSDNYILGIHYVQLFVRYLCFNQVIVKLCTPTGNRFIDTSYDHGVSTQSGNELHA